MEIQFQPTRPLRGATSHDGDLRGAVVISTHAPLAGRDIIIIWHIKSSTHFNPRAPCGARLTDEGKLLLVGLFQPTRPLRGATVKRRGSRLQKIISTHAPLAGRDVLDNLFNRLLGDFNPRAPCGARLICFPLSASR